MLRNRIIQTSHCLSLFTLEIYLHLQILICVGLFVSQNVFVLNPSSSYSSNNPVFIFQSSKLVEVLSNIWGTKFRIVGTAAHLPEDLGSVLYKTSLLHLQPRQMTVTVTELSRDDSLLAQDPNFTPAGYGDDSQDALCRSHFITVTALSVRPSIWYLVHGITLKLLMAFK